MAYKYFVFGGMSSYLKAISADYHNNPEVYVYNENENRFKRLLLRAHYSYRLNKIVRLPFKQLWYKTIMPAKHKINPRRKIFIFSESSQLSYSAALLKKTKKLYPDSILCFTFANPPNETNLSRLSYVRPFFNYVITFSQSFAKDDWVFYGNGRYSKNDIPKNNLPNTDIFFIGKNKGRLPLLLDIYDRMSELGLTCDFYITDVDTSELLPREGIVYNKYLDYLDVLKHIDKTKCVLEVLEGSYSYESLRTFEALTYGKRLITTNLAIEKSPYYMATNMHPISNASEIQKEWFSLPIEPYNIDISSFSPLRFLEFIKKLADDDSKIKMQNTD
jgi:hypothetical protein